MNSNKIYDFNRIINRKGTSSVKHGLLGSLFGDENLIPLWVADMDFATPDFILEAIRKRTEHPILGYTLRSDDFFNSIISWYKRHYQREIEKEWIVFSPGIVPALGFVVNSLTNPNDKIVVQPPVYFPFYTAITDNNRECIKNPLKLVDGRFEMDLENLKQIFEKDKPKMIIISNPHNPGGTVWRKDELIALGELCLNHNVLILSDEIHGDLVFSPHSQNVFLGLDKRFDDILIIANAPSKTFNIAGLSTSYMVIKNEELRKKVDRFIEILHIKFGTIFGNIVLETAYTNGDNWLEQLKIYLWENFTYIKNRIDNEIPKIKAMTPEATYLTFLDCRELNLSQKELIEKFKEAGLALNNGEMFGEEGIGFMRLNFATPRSVLEDAINRMVKVFGDL